MNYLPTQFSSVPGYLQGFCCYSNFLPPFSADLDSVLVNKEIRRQPDRLLQLVPFEQGLGRVQHPGKMLPLWGTWTAGEVPTCGPFCEPSSQAHLLFCPLQPLLRQHGNTYPIISRMRGAGCLCPVCTPWEWVWYWQQLKVEQRRLLAVSASMWESRSLAGLGKCSPSRCESRQGPVQIYLITSWGLICTDLHCAVFELIIKDSCSTYCATCFQYLPSPSPLAMWL